MFYHRVLHSSLSLHLHLNSSSLSLSSVTLTPSISPSLSLTHHAVSSPPSLPSSSYLIPVDGLMDVSIDLIRLSLSGSNGSRECVCVCVCVALSDVSCVCL